MFTIPAEVREEAIVAMQVVLLGRTSPSEHLSAEHIAEAFDAAVRTVFERMGLGLA